MSVAVRVIPCLDVDAGRVVKGVNFENLKDAGDPVELAKRYGAAGADELIFLDITASSSDRETTYEMVKRAADELFIPLTVGGGVRSVGDVDKLLRAGADKVGINTAGLDNPELISQAAAQVGDQCVVLSVDVRRATGFASGFEATTHGGRQSSGRDALEWITEAAQRGAGEVLLNSMDADGTKSGYDLELIATVRKIVDIPIIASGGAGKLADFHPAVVAGADAVLAASVFHFNELSIQEVKSELRRNGSEVR
jgi:cyclase